MNDEYATIGHAARVEVKVQGSRFIAVVLPVTEKPAAESAVEKVKKEFYDATHCCYAYRVGVGGDSFRSSDGGEPGGTAGKPILGAIDRKGLTNTLVVVVRYFGGTKLGIGGLARAYGDAATQALTSAGRVLEHRVEVVQATFPHAFVSVVMNIVGARGVKIVETTYDEEVHLALEVRASRAPELRALLTDRTRGNIRLR